MSAEEFRLLARSAPSRWQHLHLVHREGGGGRGGVTRRVEAWLRHGELTARDLSDGSVRRESGPAPSWWSVRPLEPIFESYTWAAMLDPYELGHAVALSDLREDDLFGRAVWRARARAQPGYQPICGCCPLVFSEVSERDERGSGYVPRSFPDGYELALDVATGIVVSDVPADDCDEMWFENEILGAG